MKRFFLPLVVCAITLGGIFLGGRDARAWGEVGHEIVGRTAAMKLPAQMPSFVRKSISQLGYLNPEPDRWRAKEESDIDKALDYAQSPDHFVDMEYVPPGGLQMPSRYDLAGALVKAGKRGNEAGFLPFRILESFQMLRIEFRLWRTTTDKTRKAWIEQRIINEAGILGHYVADGSNPHHTTMHHNGWIGDNPKGYTVPVKENGFHWRFENDFVKARIQLNEVLPLVGSDAKVIDHPREAIIAYLQNSFSKVVELYELEKREPFGKASLSPENKRFAVERLAAGGTMLRDLWWTAWVTSATDAKPIASR